MKRNIDLTMKRDFNNSDELNSFFNHIRLNFLHESKIPWKQSPMRIIRSDADLIKDSDLIYKEILITGNKDKRKETKKQRWLQSHICDCCGRSLEKYPWEATRYGLCKLCDTRYLSTERIPWKNEFSREEKRIAWR